MSAPDESAEIAHARAVAALTERVAELEQELDHARADFDTVCFDLGMCREALGDALEMRDAARRAAEEWRNLWCADPTHNPAVAQAHPFPWESR